METEHKILNLAALGVAGVLSDGIVRLGWKLVTGHKAPQDDDLEVGMLEVLVFAIISGIFLAFTRRFTVKTATKFWDKRHPELDSVSV